MPIRTIAQANQDHDLLIEIRTELGFVRNEVKDLKENLVARITAVEVEKANILTTNDHEIRIRLLERWGWKAVGALAVLQGLATAYLSLRK